MVWFLRWADICIASMPESCQKSFQTAEWFHSLGFCFPACFSSPNLLALFFHHVGEGVPYQSYPKSRVWPLPGFFFEGFVHIHSKVIIYHQKVRFSHKKLFGRCSLRPRVSRVDGWQKSNMVNFAPDSHRLANDICMDGCINSKVAMNNSYSYTKYILWFLLCASVTWKETQFYLQVSSINVDRARFSRSTFYCVTKQLQHVQIHRATEVLQLFRIDILLFSAVKTVGWCSFSQTKFI